jgi:hypothetical protein
MQVGQKIRIEGGVRSGDWEVVGTTERKVKLRCPVTHQEVQWDRFCYLADEPESTEWPQKD